MLADVEEAQALIARTVEKRRSTGDYPAKLEHDLDRHYRSILVGLARETESLVAVRSALAQLGDLERLGPDRIPTTSRTRLGRLVHRLVARLAVRQVQGVTSQLREQTVAVHLAIDNLLAIMESTLDDRRLELDRNLVPIRERIAILEARLAELHDGAPRP
tara:strand:+ start:2651 stop:3133 length:483 start_codon:yes stop_codon:yes gene_type:complete